MAESCRDFEAEKLYAEPYKKTKRWTWRGKPTRKAQKLPILERRMEGAVEAHDAALKGAQGGEWLGTKVRSLECGDGVTFKGLVKK